jgi:hypothetical protein
VAAKHGGAGVGGGAVGADVHGVQKHSQSAAPPKHGSSGSAAHTGSPPTCSASHGPTFVLHGVSGAPGHSSSVHPTQQ